MNSYISSVIFIFLLGGTVFYIGARRGLFKGFNVHELVTIAVFCSLLYIAGLPFKFGLSRIPFIHAFTYSIPFTAVLFIGIRLVPKLGTATLIIFGHSLLSQIISRGINPLWWPYALLAGFVLELYFLLCRNYLESRANVLGAGLLRGLVVYIYFYYISAPYIWHIFYAPWYIFVQTLQGVIGSGTGALIGFSLSKPIISAYRHGGL
jgi:hypothetical protein